MKKGLGEFSGSLLTYPILITCLATTIISVFLLVIKGKDLNRGFKYLIIVVLSVSILILLFMLIMIIASGKGAPPYIPRPYRS